MLSSCWSCVSCVLVGSGVSTATLAFDSTIVADATSPDMLLLLRYEAVDLVSETMTIVVFKLAKKKRQCRSSSLFPKFR